MYFMILVSTMSWRCLGRPSFSHASSFPPPPPLPPPPTILLAVFFLLLLLVYSLD